MVYSNTNEMSANEIQYNQQLWHCPGPDWHGDGSSEAGDQSHRCHLGHWEDSSEKPIQ